MHVLETNLFYPTQLVHQLCRTVFGLVLGIPIVFDIVLGTSWSEVEMPVRSEDPSR